jgi:hypothetical protein
MRIWSGWPPPPGWWRRRMLGSSRRFLRTRCTVAGYSVACRTASEKQRSSVVLDAVFFQDRHLELERAVVVFVIDEQHADELLADIDLGGIVSPKTGPAFVKSLPVGKFHGTAARFHALGIQTGLDIRGQSLALLEAHFGKAGAYYYRISRDIDERPVRANRIRMSVGAENTFFADLTVLSDAPF